MPGKWISGAGLLAVLQRREAVRPQARGGACPEHPRGGAFHDVATQPARHSVSHTDHGDIGGALSQHRGPREKAAYRGNTVQELGTGHTFPPPSGRCLEGNWVMPTLEETGAQPFPGSNDLTLVITNAVAAARRDRRRPPPLPLTQKLSPKDLNFPRTPAVLRPRPHRPTAVCSASATISST